MTKVTYHGEYPEGRDAITQHGHVFERGKSVDVTDKGVLARFAANRFFEVAGESDKDDVKEGKQEAEQANAERLREWLTAHKVPFHHKLGVTNLQALKDDYLKAEAKAQEA